MLTPGMACTNLEDVLSGEINQSQKGKCARIYSYEVPRVIKVIETESRTMVPKVWGERRFV